MISKDEIDEVLRSYDKGKISIGTLGSHSALNIFKGAQEEGFRTVCICRKGDEIVYQRFPVADDILVVEGFRDLLNDDVQEKLRRLNTILVPHGSFTAYISTGDLMNELRLPLFGNRQLLLWEADREKQREWLGRAGLNLPKIFKDPEDIEGLVIVKFPGAKGGRGYFLASSPQSFHQKARDMVEKGLLKEEDLARIHLQEYFVGVNVYPLYFRSLVVGEVELLGIDRRYESAIDGIGRIPAREQLEVGLNPTYTVVGNIPLTVRESLLSEILRMGDSVVKVSEEIAPPGIIGPFCLETVVTDALRIVTFEISARIVAGANVGIGISPYSYLKHGEKMYMGKRIAREIRAGIEGDNLEKIVS
ncbi:formate--phosphoribosylaminoimidazolecarboxamide ligase [Candidatus Hecatella orcuttiae]|jgi:5-formaminoimidazole-4-carboxamide-1-(beta)-D-ribofuranosyl 5'-monophosphate synthetase|uniref:formate--phosphoribosylaminoimidazolecarboxamide ligase n=1 Tax=Candidatus Hecatella orcuttiae TaxID=1935119 RepID=UPI002867E51E|nr:formate--phosphoribosylaminoimidazolecarboxamide ligase [Candidatus Hecatella orcuttiae]